MAGDTKDKELVRRMRAGSEAAFSEFFDGFFPRLYRFARARVGSDADAAEEVAQAALSRAVTKLHTYRGEAALFTWLCTFCRHELSAYYKRHHRTGPPVDLLEDRPELRAALESLARDAAWKAEDEARHVEMGRLVQATLDHLPSRFSRALEWKYLDGLSVKEIAGQLGVRPKAAESLLTRAREAFREVFPGFVAAAGAKGEAT